MTTWPVATQSELTAALAAAVGGDTILLNPAGGPYGGDGPFQNRQYADWVTITTAVPGTLAVIDGPIRLDGSSHLRFEEIHSPAKIRTDTANANNIEYLNGRLNGWYFTKLTTFKIAGNVVEFQFFFTCNAGSEVAFGEVSDNIFDDARPDIGQVKGNCHHIAWLRNAMLGVSAANTTDHPDVMQFAASDGVTPHHWDIIGNLLWDNPATGVKAAQGLFISDPHADGYRFVVVEDNLINVGGGTNALYMNGATEGCRIANNTVVGSIRLDDKSGQGNPGLIVTRNASVGIIDESQDSQIVDNWIGDVRAELPDLAAGGTWLEYVPASGSPLSPPDGYGAVHRLMELLGQSPPPEPEPEPEPEPGDPSMPMPAFDPTVYSTDPDVVQMFTDYDAIVRPYVDGLEAQIAGLTDQSVAVTDLQAKVAAAGDALTGAP